MALLANGSDSGLLERLGVAQFALIVPGPFQFDRALGCSGVAEIAVQASQFSRVERMH